MRAARAHFSVPYYAGTQREYNVIRVQEAETRELEWLNCKLDIMWQIPIKGF
jgi:hypothetical protein